MRKDKEECGEAAAAKAGEILKKIIGRKGEVVFVASTGASHFEFLKAITSDPEIDWSKTTMFHLDEYVGVSDDHPASFRKYLRERLVDKVNPGEVYLIQGDAENLEEECERLNSIISKMNVDIAFLGIGENSHIAFNDPPADFETDDPYIIVELDEKCRRQQAKEGWFNNIDEVPQRAVSMSINQIMDADHVVCTVPEERKAEAVKRTLEEDISPEIPASILREHDNAYLYLDENSAKLTDL